MSSLDQTGLSRMGGYAQIQVESIRPVSYTHLDVYKRQVLSGNRNFEGRIHAEVKMNYLASPPLVVAYALAGSTEIDIAKDPLGTDAQGAPVYLKDLWPSNQDIHTTILATLGPDMFKQNYADVFKGCLLYTSRCV